VTEKSTQRNALWLISIFLLVINLNASLEHPASAREIKTNELEIASAPNWLTESRTQKVIDQIERLMEWDIRKIQVIWYQDQAAFESVHGFGPSVLAFARRSDNTVHVGPRVSAQNFDGIFGHELVHVIVYQKYKDAIPSWLDEGLANYAAQRINIDYAWLASQPYRDIRELTHPFKPVKPASPADSVNTISDAETGLPMNARYHYMASTALMQMLASHCDIHDLLQLSVGKKLETYVSTFCEIPDLNSAFKKWIESKSKSAIK